MRQSRARDVASTGGNINIKNEVEKPDLATRTTGLGIKVKKLFPSHFSRLVIEIRNKHYSIRTEHAYENWLVRYIAFNAMQEPAMLDEKAVVAFLEHLVIDRGVSSSTQSQALCAIVFFYKYVIKKELGEFGLFLHSKKPRRLPVVLSQQEIK
ncbi:MAG: hypothetical protein GXP19_09350 [Gammaproteobacteria bacterium]|nr:hypothetical protein [Gammaproteobacteria bacterium]